MAISLGALLAVLVPALGWVLFTLMAQAPDAAPAVVPWFLLGFGLLSGAGQARLLRPWLGQGGFWALGSGGALFVASLATHAITGAYLAMPGPDDRFGLGVLLHVGQGAVLGAAVGLVQFPLLTRTRHPPSRWLVANIAIWAAADGLGTLFSGPERTDAAEVRWILNLLLMPGLAAIAGGGTLAWLLGLPGRRLSRVALAGVLGVTVAGVAQSGTWALERVQAQPGQQFGETFIASDPAWSPDGQQLAFVWGQRYGPKRLYLAPASGGPAAPLSGYDDILFVRWAPSGDYLCYGNYAGLRPAPVPGRPATPGAWCEFGTTGSPDGRWTASTLENEIVLVGPDGERRVLPVENPDVPSWSPDGTQLLFRTFRRENYEVYLINVDGTGETNLSQYAGHDSQPLWLPDGRSIVFESDRDGARNLYVLAIESRSLRPLTTNTHPNLSFYGVVLAPDGQQLVYHTYWFDAPSEPVSAFAGAHLLQTTGTGSVALPEPDEDQFWSWSPDGTRLVTAREGRLWVVNADGTQPRALSFSFSE
jgi:Tol biopolymer transport system component